MYVWHATDLPGYTWHDPDGYIRMARRLATRSGWHWTFDVARYRFDGRTFALPPLYPVFLSAFVRARGFPATVLIVQGVLSSIAMLAVFAIGRQVHSPRAGLVAATAYAAWVPAIFVGVWSTSQETLYLPLVLLAFALLLEARRASHASRFAVAGVVFGVAALTRSMPAFFVLPAAALHVALGPARRVALRQAASAVLAFAVVTVPYSIGLSRALGQPTFIDSHGGIHLVESSGEAGTQPLGVLETARALWRAAISSPRAFLSESVSRARTLLYVNGGRILELYVDARSKAGALAWKVAVHAGTDVLLVAAVILAPFGLVLCRDPGAALFLALWIAVNASVASLGGFGGARLRMPFEPMLAVLAAVVVAGEWAPPDDGGRAALRRVVLTGAAVVSLVLAWTVLAQLSRSLASWPSYGVVWSEPLDRERGVASGSAGFNVPVRSGVAQFTIRAAAEPGARQRDEQLDVQVLVGGVPAERVSLGGVPRALRYRAPGPVAYVELRPRPTNTSIEIVLTR